jgi:hypothetical protein
LRNPVGDQFIYKREQTRKLFSEPFKEASYKVISKKCGVKLHLTIPIKKDPQNRACRDYKANVIL